MKVLSSDGLTKLIQIIKTTFATKESLSTVATTGSYSDLSNKPTIPTVNNKTITIQKNGTTVDSFTTNASSNKTINITVPTTAADVNAVPTTRTINGKVLSSNITLSASDVSALPSSTVIPTVDQSYSGSSTNAQSGVAVKSAIDAAVSSVYKPGGSVAFASLPTPRSTNEGYVYNVTDAFTTTSSFVEGAGIDYPAGTNVVIVDTGSSTYKFDTLTGAFQPLLVSGTNIKTINNTSILGSGNIDIQSGSSYTAGTGIDITNDVISVTSPTLINRSSQGLAIGGSSTAGNSTDIAICGSTSAKANGYNIAIGYGSFAGGSEIAYALALGQSANATKDYSIQLGKGTNSEANSFYVGTSTSNNWKMLGSDGTIPNARLNVMTGADGTNAGTKGAVPAPTATDNTKFLRGDGTWAAVSGGGSDVEEYSIAEIEALWDGESE